MSKIKELPIARPIMTGPQFDPVEADLEDVYFSTMVGHYTSHGELPEQEASP